MMEKITNEVKRNAEHRRHKANSSSKVAHDASDHQFNVLPNMMVSNNLLSIEPMDVSSSTDQTSIPAEKSATSHGHAASSLPHDHDTHRCLGGMETSSIVETDFIMKYLDFVFPALFPFYRPALFETGRSWLLILLGKSKIAYHATVSLSFYFFTMALTDVESSREHAECKDLRWEEVEEQTNKCFESLRTDMLAMSPRSEGTEITALGRVELMESFVQVLVFEIALGRSSPWNSHLPPAFALFEEIMASPGQSDQAPGQSKFVSVLLEIGQPMWVPSGESVTGNIWSPDQAGFRFCAGLLIFIDVVASTAIQQKPKLLEYHHDVLHTVDDGTFAVSNAEIRLSGLVGCRNWVVRSITEISVLDSWKREQIESNSLSVVELVGRASILANDIKAGISELHDSAGANPAARSTQGMPFDMLPSPFISSTSSLIWAHAAQLYLTIVVSGWQMSNAEVRANVAQIIELLQSVPSHQLRALAWPLSVAGCLALESEESSFNTLFANQGKFYTAGALNDARQIMARVWQVRTTLHASTWNLASCFSILGSPVLLV